jgi:hypothetical protein
MYTEIKLSVPLVFYNKDKQVLFSILIYPSNFDIGKWSYVFFIVS